ncbi:helix-hairpin-helix domain-containing protein [Deinococcus sp. 14RED07]|uniref:helix-hairpin-helix domain-containing protein n=1 Tax=unclassified Deinococcus TaxID=2623546 RepID=UPI001E51C14E|nr:helix-hairpin-helix domain-containing protein [Deinococcus sp. 14RED07]MCD0176807.1 helix-hairpin-helix domain-containing protein [Deinococcus sp. 14RED07]
MKTRILLTLSAALLLAGPAGAQVITCKAPININTATDAQLRAIGLGPKLIAEVHDYRPFRNAAHVRKEMGKYMKATSLTKLLTCVKFK